MKNSPELNLNYKKNPDCSLSYDVAYYTFADNFLKCNETASSTNSSFGVSVKNSDTGKNDEENFSADIVIAEGKDCPGDCSKKTSVSCSCSEISIFDPAG